MNEVLINVCFVIFALTSLLIAFVTGYLFNKVYKVLDSEDTNVLIIPSDMRKEKHEGIEISEGIQDNMPGDIEVQEINIGCTE